MTQSATGTSHAAERDTVMARDHAPAMWSHPETTAHLARKGVTVTTAKLPAIGMQLAMRKGTAMEKQSASVQANGLVIIAKSAPLASLASSATFFVSVMRLAVVEAVATMRVLANARRV